MCGHCDPTLTELYEIGDPEIAKLLEELLVVEK